MHTRSDYFVGVGLFKPHFKSLWCVVGAVLDMNESWEINVIQYASFAESPFALYNLQPSTIVGGPQYGTERRRPGVSGARTSTSTSTVLCHHSERQEQGNQAGTHKINYYP